KNGGIEAKNSPATFLEWLQNLLNRSGVNRKPLDLKLREQMAFLRLSRDVGGRSADLKKACNYFSEHLDTPEVSNETHPLHWLAIYILPRWKKIAADGFDTEDRFS